MSSAGEDALIGQHTGSFRIERVLGRGAMGTVYLGVHRVIGSRVAVKVIHAELVGNPQLVARFEAEARAVNRVAHENVVSIFDFGVLEGGRPYLVMELLEGRALSALLQTPMAPDHLLRVLVQTCAGLEVAHAHGVVHRDLKPDNIFLVDRPGRPSPVVKILDFGVARMLGGDITLERTSAGMLLGTPAYMAPEQCGGTEVDGRTDLYALGMTAWRALVGRIPFKGSLIDILHAHRTELPAPPHTVNPNVPEALSRIVMKALAKNPDDRWSSAAEMRAALEACNASMAADAPAGEQTVGVFGAGNELIRRVEFSQLSRGGVFLHWAPPHPPINSSVLLELPVPGRTLRLRAEVVRHVKPDQARAWGMPTGVGVQFTAVPDEARARLSGWLGDARRSNPSTASSFISSNPPTRTLDSRFVTPIEETGTPEEDWDRRIDEIFASWYERASGNHYQILKVRPDAHFDEIRDAANTLFSDLTANEPSTDTQAKQVKGALARVRTAMVTLCDPALRAAYDAEQGNFHGVALCIGAGLSTDTLASLRRDYLKRSDRAADRTRACIDTAESLTATGLNDAAREMYERALRQDPLNLELHKRLARVMAASGQRWPAAPTLA
ncbi:MAG: protein kinase [Myxococcaceae bacterium]